MKSILNGRACLLLSRKRKPRVVVESCVFLPLDPLCFNDVVSLSSHCRQPHLSSEEKRIIVIQLLPVVQMPGRSVCDGQ